MKKFLRTDVSLVSEEIAAPKKSFMLTFKFTFSGETFAELQEKARGIISEWELETDNPVLVLLEDLCKEGDRITEEAKRDHEDLLQQVSDFYCHLILPVFLKHLGIFVPPGKTTEKGKSFI